jgi:hypothetical protein
MDPIIIIDCGPDRRYNVWTHIINIEDLAEHYNRTVPQLMEYLKVALMSIGTYENRVFGEYNSSIIKAALLTLKVLDIMNMPRVSRYQQQQQQQQQLNQQQTQLDQQQHA